MENRPGRCGRPGVRAGRALATGLAMSNITVAELWNRCLDLGGTLSLAELHEYLADQSSWAPHDHNIAALALNDYLAEGDIGALVPYSFDL
jgi:hypothetical protein